VPTKIPPQEDEYQLHEAAVPREPPEKLNVVLAPLQIGLGLAAALVGAVDADAMLTL
jgi:hypothetical protein